MTDKGNDLLAAHEEIVQKVLEEQPDDEVLYDLAELFKVFGDSTRIKILYALSASELCVGDIAQILHLSQSSVSHQLRILKDSKLVRFRREGKAIFYALDDEHVRNIINMGMEHVEE
ncbi:MAG: metalloregulator ArsR/SmtB family transcription factor [Parabacteroides sp.]|nr:metalloregulator ArsR/SmtB family transcription factor [Parabacteroides sp.]